MSESDPHDLDVLMERIRADLRKPTTGGLPSQTAGPSNTSSSGNSPSSGNRYRFAEFKYLDNETFIRDAYLAVLGREPDESGRFTILHRLESGQIGRASLLLELINSSEARSHAVKISGLKGQAALERMRYNRLTRLTRTLLRLFRNSPHIANHIRQLAAQAADAERMALRAVTTADTAQRLAKSGAESQSESIDRKLREQRDWFERQIEAVRGDFDEGWKRFSFEFHNTQADMQSKLLEHWRNLVDQKLRLDILLKEVRSRMPEALEQDQQAAIVNEEQHLLDSFYVAFEDRYRGSRADIKNRQKIYLAEIERAVSATSGASVVDVGCGRGEWLELLRESGFSAKGYDLNRVMVQESQQRGFDVTLADAFEALAAMPNDSLSAITGFHIIEHLPFGRVVQLFDQALRVLRSGGLIIFETPNPGNLLVASERFYLDPTHRNPLPAELIAFVAEARGFVSVERRFLHPPPDCYAAESAEEPLLELLRNRIYAPQDYAIVGWKA